VNHVPTIPAAAPASTATPSPGIGGGVELSVIVPAFNERGNVGELLDRLRGTLTGVDWEVIYVDDDSPDGTADAVRAFARVDRRYEAVARTLGDDAWRAFRRVTLPLSLRGLTAAAIVMWARAVSEFGAIVILTYNPKVASVLSYDRFTSEGLDGALPVAAVLVILALVPLLVLRTLRARVLPGELTR